MRGGLLLADGVVRLFTGARGLQLMPGALNLSRASMLGSLPRIESLDAKLVLFGHGEPWTEAAAAAVERARALGPT